MEECRASSGPLPAADAFVAVDAEHVVIDWVKKCEDSDDVLIRLYEAYGQRGPAMITFGLRPKKAAECDLMEENDEAVPVNGHSVELYLRPYEIRTLKVSF